MRAVLRFFWELVSQDPWRKLGAVGLAFFLWLYVHQRITGEKQFTLEIRPTTINSWESEPGFFYVRVPKGKILQTYPSPNNQILVTLRGTNRDLAALAGPLTAFFDPADEKGDLPVDRVGVAVDKIHWDHPQVQDLLKGIRPEQFNLNFENIELAELALKPEMLEIQGQPPEGFAVQLNQTQFVPTAVKVSGPKRSIEKLKRGEFGPLFKPFSLRKDDTSSPQSFLLDLTEEAQKEHLTIEDRGARAFVPIKPRVSEITFRARIYPVSTGERAKDLLEMYRLQGSSGTQAWVERDWIAEIPGTLAAEVTKPWLENNVRFSVDLGVIRRPDEEFTAEIEVKQDFLVPTADRPRFEEVRFRPSDAVRGKVIVEKRNGK